VGESALWSGEHLNWPELSGWLREAIRVADRRKAQGEELAPSLVSTALCRKIIGHFLGDDWFLRNAMPDSRVTSFLFPVFDGDEGVAPLYTVRLFSLAECLFHLQYIENAVFPIRSLVNEEQMESAIAELQVGSILFQNRIPFKYIPTSTAPGVSTPDIELRVGSDVAVADVKCKYEGKDYTPGCFKSAFSQARKQIGAGNSGIIFIKVPQKWSWIKGGELLLLKQAVDEVKGYMKGTSRVAKTVFYTFYFSREPTGLHVRNAVVEAPSIRNEPASPWNRILFTGDAEVGWLMIPTIIEMARLGNAYYRT
jgi:hypothetical protein